MAFAAGSWARAKRTAAVFIAAIALIPTTLSLDEQDHAEFRYANGFAGTGDFQGTCDLGGFYPRKTVQTELIITHAGGLVTIYETKMNRTLLHPGTEPIQYVFEPAQQTAAISPLSAGELNIAFDTGSHLLGLPSDTPSPTAEAEFDGSQWETGPIINRPSYGPHYPKVIGSDLVGQAIAFAPQYLHGWVRTVQVGTSPAKLNGGFDLRMDAVRLQAADFQRALPSYEWSTDAVDMRPAAYRDTLVLTYAVVQLEDANFAIDSKTFAVYCSNLEWKGTGSVTLRNTHGEVTRGTETRSFERKELTLHGTFAVSERPEEVSRGIVPEGWVHGSAEGSFDAVGFDFSSVDLGKHEWSTTLATTGLVALLLATIGSVLAQTGRFVGFFFSRFDPESAPKHPNRRLILNMVQARPGIGVRELANETRMNYSVLRHHLHVLHVVGLVKWVHMHGVKHVYHKDESLAVARRTLALDGDPMVKFLHDQAAMHPVERRIAGRLLQQRFGVSRVGAWKAIRRAVASGALRSQPAERGDILRLADVSVTAISPQP